MPEVADSGKYHRKSKPVGRGDHIAVANRASRLNRCCDPVFRRFLQPVRERKERVRSQDCTLQAEERPSSRRLYRIDTAHLTGAGADGLACIGVKDRVRFDVLGYFPGEFERLPLGFGRLALRDNLRLGAVESRGIRSLGQDSSGDALRSPAPVGVAVTSSKTQILLPLQKASASGL